MLFVEYTENDTKKAINIAMCHTIETSKHQTNSHSDFYLKMFAPNGPITITFKTEEQLDTAFDMLMKAIQAKNEYLKLPDPHNAT